MCDSEFKPVGRLKQWTSMTFTILFNLNRYEKLNEFNCYQTFLEVKCTDICVFCKKYLAFLFNNVIIFTLILNLILTFRILHFSGRYSEGLLSKILEVKCTYICGFCRII